MACARQSIRLSTASEALNEQAVSLDEAIGVFRLTGQRGDWVTDVGRSTLHRRATLRAAVFNDATAEPVEG